MGGVYKHLSEERIEDAKRLLSLGFSYRKTATALRTTPYILQRTMAEIGFVKPPPLTAEEAYANKCALAREFARDGATVAELRTTRITYEDALRIYREENNIQRRSRYTSEDIEDIRKMIEQEGRSKMYVARYLDAPISTISKLCKRHKIGVWQ